MSAEAIKNLQQIKGIGKIIAQRLVDSGIDSPLKLIQAGEERLGTIAGLQPRMIPSILAQASTLAEGMESVAAESPVGAEKGVTEEGDKKGKRQRKLSCLQQTSDQLRNRVQGLVVELLDKKVAQKKSGKRLQKEVDKLLKSLSKVEAKMGGRLKKAKQGLAGVEKRLESLVGLGPNKLARGLKKARRPLKRVIG